MPPRQHAVLSASSSHRWLHCTPSARLTQKFEDRETEAAKEGIAAHALCEHKLRCALKIPSEKPSSTYDSEEMDFHTDGYVQFVLETITEAQKTCADPIINIEQRLDFSCYVPEGFGTGDCVIVSDQTLHIIDFKYGVGVFVEAENNPQMMLYALGALHMYDSLYDIEEVAMIVYQPRRENISTWMIPVSELKAWAENTLRPKAILAFEGKGEYTPGPWCTFCGALVTCRARAEEMLKLAQYEFAKPPLLADTEIEEILGKLDALIKWAEAIQKYALNAAINDGKQWNGWKLVNGKSNREYADENAVITAANAAGYHNIHRQTLLPITEMEKLMGKKSFQTILGKLVNKPPGNPKLVPLSDKRSEIKPAKADFAEE